MKTSKRIVIAGGSGFLGQRLTQHFIKAGSDVVILSRSPKAAAGIGRWALWDACTSGTWEHELEGADALVNLTGKSVNCRYTTANRREILYSRVNSTRILGEAIRRCFDPPRVWLNASTATIYRHTCGKAWDEAGEIAATAAVKDQFSVDVAQAWEEGFANARTPDTRKVTLRMAMVLGLEGNSVFPTLRRLAARGFGGRMGSGEQFVSWIHDADYCRAVEWLICHTGREGVFNVAAPNPVKNGDMMRILREACGVQWGLPAPRWILELGAILLGTESELVIKSRRVVPGRLLESGFTFEFPGIREAFEELVSRKPVHPHEIRGYPGSV